MSENWPWNSLKMTNESKSFVDNQFFSPLPWKWKGNTNKAAAKIPPKKQLQFLIKTERFAATKLKDHFTTDTFTLFHLIYYKNPPHSFWFVISSLTRRCPVVEGWLLSTKVPLTITLQQSSFPCGTEGWEFAPAALKGSVMRCALRWEETWWEPLPIPICWLYWSSLRPYVCAADSETGSTSNISYVPLYADDLSFYTIMCDIHLMSCLFQSIKGCRCLNTWHWLNKPPQG